MTSALRWVFPSLILLATVLPAPRSAWADDLVYDMAILRGLDKVTGRVQVIDAPVGTEVQFGTLTIMAHTCRKKPPEELPEAAAFLDIYGAPANSQPGDARATLFRGWMFASSPALDALENPVYDIWVTDCANSADRSTPPPGKSR